MERKITDIDETEKRNRELCELVKQNDLYAQTEILLLNEGLISQLARSLEVAHDLDINHYGGIELDDILQEGRFALLEAAKIFDENEDVKFSTFAYTVAGNAMRDLCRKGDSSFERQLANHGIVQVFLDDNPVDEDGVPEAEKVRDGKGRDPVGEEAVLRVMIQKMRNRLVLLPPRERRLLMYRYGIQSLEYKTIAETAAFFHLTENYLRLIEKRALDVLREGMNDGKIL
ncbi:MAG: sigma-70 family RNA polymerase sigma factor [Lachnospiraceae bacterium]|nr:sigma-70 family RNA polymerase sigma factor [Lachnospiraceae bacterium]MBR6475063.1 sigma-70 family RNA polymerase sigma factor [Lachnospiraceae bacterium]